uniref:PE-PGRS family protein n=1 Tax=Parastrongyloides trichosuri TaxID=131310 RepID=A0A0N4ZXV1_PARTI
MASASLARRRRAGPGPDVHLCRFLGHAGVAHGGGNDDDGRRIGRPDRGGQRRCDGHAFRDHDHPAGHRRQRRLRRDPGGRKLPGLPAPGRGRRGGTPGHARPVGRRTQYRNLARLLPVGEAAAGRDRDPPPGRDGRRHGGRDRALYDEGPAGGGAEWRRAQGRAGFGQARHDHPARAPDRSLAERRRPGRGPARRARRRDHRRQQRQPLCPDVRRDLDHRRLRQGWGSLSSRTEDRRSVGDRRGRLSGPQRRTADLPVAHGRRRTGSGASHFGTVRKLTRGGGVSVIALIAAVTATPHSAAASGFGAVRAVYDATAATLGLDGFAGQEAVAPATPVAQDPTPAAAETPPRARRDAGRADARRPLHGRKQRLPGPDQAPADAGGPG